MCAFSLLLTRLLMEQWNQGTCIIAVEKLHKAWKIFYNHFQSSARPLIVTSCFTLHCHCFLLPYTKQDWPFFGPCLDSHSHSMSGLVPCCKTCAMCCSNICNTKANYNYSVDLTIRGSIGTEHPGIWRLMTWDPELMYTVHVHTGISNYWTGIWTAMVE